VAERRRRTRHDLATRALDGEEAVVRDLAERNDDAQAGEPSELGDQVPAAGLDLGRRRPVRRRRTARDRGDEGVAQTKPVVAVHRRRLVRKAGPVERPVEPVPALVAREDAARAVPAVRGRGETDDEHSRAGVAETGNRPPPVRPVAEAGDLLARHALAVLDESRAEPTPGEPRLEPIERGHSPQRTPAVTKSACVSCTVPVKTAPSPAGSTARTVIAGPAASGAAPPGA